MSNSNKTQSISQAVWDRHKRTIERLYVQEGRKLEKPAGVIEFMKKHQNFYARYVFHCINIARAYVCQQVTIRDSIPEMANTKEPYQTGVEAHHSELEPKRARP
jgi:hypothetical protein